MNTQADIVVCAHCQKSHEGFSLDQAMGCAAEVVEDSGITGIFGHYGSLISDGIYFCFEEAFTKDQRPKVGDIICDCCLQDWQSKSLITKCDMPIHHPLDNEEEFADLICGVCSTHFPAFGKSQAGGCAAQVSQDQKQIHGYYGSAVADMTEFLFTEKMTKPLAPGTQICDGCLNVMIETGKIVENGETDLFGHFPIKASK